MRILNSVATRLLRLYQIALSPYFGVRCKYEPSCSQYACDCLQHYGFIKSIGLIGWRVLRCNPWSHGGYDPAVKHSSHQ